MDEDLYGDGLDIGSAFAHSGGDAFPEYEEPEESSSIGDAIPDGTHFEISICKHVFVSVGLSINETSEGDTLHIESVITSGLVDVWNQTCNEDLVVRRGDRILRVNVVGEHFDDIMKELSGLGDKKLEVVRGPFPTPQAACFYHGRLEPELAVETVASLVPDSAQMRLRTAPALDSSIGSEDLQALLARRLAESRNGR